MVLVGDFNKEIIGLFKSKYPTEKEKLLELNLSSISKNPSFNYNILSSNVEKSGNKIKCCDGVNACCGEDSSSNRQMFTLDGNSTLKWNIFSTQMETKMDMNGISIVEAKTKPYYGLSLTSKYERFPKNSMSVSGSGNLEIGGDIQSEYFQSRFRMSPTLESLGCVNKLNKENKNSIGMMISNTITLRQFSSINSLSFGTMLSSSNVNLPYNKNSLKVVMGLMIKGPLFMSTCKKLNTESSCHGMEQYNYQSLIQKKESFGSRFKNNSNNINNNDRKVNEVSTVGPNYTLSIQTNTNNHNNKLSGFTGGLVLNNLARNYLTLGLMMSYNIGNVNSNSNNSEIGLMRGDNNQSIEVNNGLTISNNRNFSNTYESLSRFSEKVQYTIGGKISFGSIDNCCLFGKKLSCSESGCFDNSNCANGDENNSLKSTDLKFKVMNNFKMAYSLTHRFTRNISATFGAQVDPKKLSNPDSVKYGFILDMTA